MPAVAPNGIQIYVGETTDSAALEVKVSALIFYQRRFGKSGGGKFPLNGPLLLSRKALA